MSNQITYDDKVDLNVASDVANINKVTATDMNEIKSVVNSHANDIDTANNNITNLDNDKLDINEVLNQASTDTDKPYSANYLNSKLVSVGATAPINGERVWFAKGKNLFDKNNINLLNCYFTATNPYLQPSDVSKTAYIEIKPNTTYTISKVVTARFSVGYTSTVPTTSGFVSGAIGGISSATSFTITTGENAHYLVVWFYAVGVDTLTYQEVIDTIQIEEGSTVTSYEAYIKPAIYVDGYKIYELN